MRIENTASYQKTRNILMASVGLLALATTGAQAQVVPGDLIISESTFVPNTGEAANLTPGSQITVDGNALTSTGVGGSGTPVLANASDANLGVFANHVQDGNFGITAPLTILSVNPTSGAVDQSLTLPTSSIVTSFSSKSEGTLNVSTDGKSISIVGYHVTTDANSTNPVGALDVSNSSTTAFVDPLPTLPAGNSPRTDNRTVGQLTIGTSGTATTTDVNAYSGNNGRAAINVNGTLYLAGNANVGNTGIEKVLSGVSASGATANSAQVGQYNITQNGYAADKLIKDNNFRGITVYNGTMYATKGSGSNGIDTLYQIGATGALNNGGQLATGASTPITVVPGFPTDLAKGGASAPQSPTFTPFGIWFANATTMYVSDEGSGGTADTGSATGNTVATLGAGHAGLEKWSLVGGTWVLDYTLQTGLIGTSQTYSATGFTGTVFENGLRDITGQVNANGTVTIFGVTATVDNVPNMDNGADPNEIVAITDNISATTLPGSESFSVIEAPVLGTVYRGVADVPEPVSLALFGTGLVGLMGARSRRKA